MNDDTFCTYFPGNITIYVKSSVRLIKLTFADCLSYMFFTVHNRDIQLHFF